MGDFPFYPFRVGFFIFQCSGFEFSKHQKSNRKHLNDPVQLHGDGHPHGNVSEFAGRSAPPNVLVRFYRLSQAYWSGRGQWRPILLVVCLVIIVIAQVALAIRLNLWSADLFNALERRSTDGAVTQIGIFAIIVAGTMTGNTANLLVRRRLQVGWRRWLTALVVGDWMAEARHYQAGLIPGNHANPDGRIAEDIRIATESAVEMGASLLYALLVLASFVGILWSLSGWVTLAGINLPGHLVLLAFAYAGTGAVVAMMLGRRLVGATDNRQSQEAEFRFSLIRALDDAEPISLARGEAMERARLISRFDAIIPSWRDQSKGLSRLTAFSTGYGTVAGVLPILVGSWRFLANVLSLGALMQSAQAFQQITSALSWPIDNLPQLAAWRASVERVMALHDAVDVVRQEAARRGATAINLNRDGGTSLGVRDLWIAAPDGTAMLADLTLQVEPGERVLVDGDAEAAAALFRVLAGIWPWGHGIVDLPGDSEMLAVGSRPFLPEGSLRQAITFQMDESGHDDTRLAACLDEVGLPSLAARLGETANWSRLLNGADLQRLTFARLLLNRPRWIVLGNATDALDPDIADRMLKLLVDGDPEVAVVVIGRHPGSPDSFIRRLSLHRPPGGDMLLDEIFARRQAAQQMKPKGLDLLERLTALAQIRRTL